MTGIYAETQLTKTWRLKPYNNWRENLPSLSQSLSTVAAMNGGNSRKRQAPSQNPSPAPPKHHATMEEEDFDEDVYLPDDLIDEDSQILRDLDERSAHLARLTKWARPHLSPSYKSQSQSIGTVLLT